ncbi:MAG TPA: bacterial transcriptional activator domain-containing protein [Puia sp.]|nr:bacterial transcriptional activator domain-containing protein [Puia sp.]
MKVAHRNSNLVHATDKHITAWLREAREMESGEDPEMAVAEYQKIIRAHPLKEEAYERLMIIYRKTKQHKKESAIISKAIRTFEKGKRKAAPGSNDRTVTRLSNAISKATGLLDKKGTPLYQAQPMARWRKRQRTVDS